MKLERETPGPGQESVWDYPRPPRIEPAGRTIRVVHRGRVIASSERALRVLETSHPPVYYLPPEDVDLDCLRRTKGASLCEWKGQASYYDVVVGDHVASEAAWTYEQPTDGAEVLHRHIAFYAHKLDECLVDGERARPQAGGFYGGWITSHVVGPFKGETGTLGW